MTIPVPAEAVPPKVESQPVAPASEPETRPESAPSVEGSEPTEPAPNPGEEKPKRSANGRIAELYAQKRTAEAEAMMARQEAVRLRDELGRIQQARNHPDTPYEHQDALRMREAVKAERMEQLASEAEVKAHTARQHRSETFYERVSAVRDRMPDFDQVFEAVPVSDVAADLLADSEYGPQIAYHLGKNPVEAKRIYSLPPHLQGREIARIEASVSVPVRKVSTAPPPPPRLGGGSSPGGKDPADMSQAEYSEWYRKRSRG
jgi:hypothetical protein